MPDSVPRLWLACVTCPSVCVCVTCLFKWSGEFHTCISHSRCRDGCLFTQSLHWRAVHVSLQACVQVVEQAVCGFEQQGAISADEVEPRTLHELQV